MKNEDIFQEVKNIIVEIAEIEADTITMDSDIMSDLELSSLEILRLIAEIETKLSVRIPDSKTRDIISVGDLVSVVAEVVQK